MSVQKDKMTLEEPEIVDTPSDASDKTKDTGKFFIFTLDVDPIH